MSSNVRLKFQDVYYDPHTIRWGKGNDAIGLEVLATIKIREKTKKELLEEKKKFEAAEKIYEEFIQVGQKFRASGEKAIRGIECKITYIHYAKQAVSWKQYNMTEEQRSRGCKPAAGKFSINSMMALLKCGEIEFIKE